MGYVLEREQLVGRPISEVFAFFADASNLGALTPPFLHFRILTPLPIQMRTGSIIEHQIRLFGFPVSWQSLIESFEPNRRFVDVQLRGPYRTWRHEHEFVEVPEGTLVKDRVEYQMPFGIFGKLARALMVDRTLQSIFDYRREAMAKPETWQKESEPSTDR